MSTDRPAAPAQAKTTRQIAAEAAAGFADGGPSAQAGGLCPAPGCPLRGSVDTGHSGRYLCHCHAYVPVGAHHEVTRRIRAHEWMLEIIRNVKAAGSRETQWRKVAMLAWAIEPDMIPHAQETQALYVARLLQDFEHRVGARSAKPGPMLPQHLQSLPAPLDVDVRAARYRQSDQATTAVSAAGALR